MTKLIYDLTPVEREFERAQAAMRMLAQQSALQRMANQISAEITEKARAHARMVEEIFRPNRQLIEFFAQIEREDQEFRFLAERAYELGLRGWTVPMWAPPAVVKSFLTEDHLALVHRELVKYFSAARGLHARELIASVCKEPKLGHWAKLLRQASSAFRRRQYSLVVPALFVVLEGRVAHATGALKSRPAVQRDAASGRRNARSGIGVAAWASIHGFVVSTFSSLPFSAEPPPRLNRHWTLHGRAVPDWSRVDCLMLWQAIGTITDATP